MKRWHILTLIIIVAVVALVARYQTKPGTGDLAAARACQANLKKLAIGMEMFATDNSGKYPQSVAELVPTYLPEVPHCPEARQDTYTEGFQTGPSAPTNDQGSRDFFYIACSGEHHTKSGLAAGLPAFSCTAGLIPELPFEGGPQEARTQCEQNLKNIATALEMHATDSQGKYPETLAPLSPNYLAKVPNCPVTGSDSYSHNYKLADNSLHWSVNCSDPHEGSPPTYDSQQGLLQAQPFKGDDLEAKQQCEGNIEKIATAVEMYTADWHGKYPRTLAPLSPNYLVKIPDCPLTGSDNYSANYKMTNEPAHWTLNCSAPPQRDSARL